VRRETLERHPAVAAELAKLSGRISAEDMRRMNYAVDGEKKDAQVVVKEKLEKLEKLESPTSERQNLPRRHGDTEKSRSGDRA
jgi:Substrate binding domain of ABC-type glycine betaine transport system